VLRLQRDFKVDVQTLVRLRFQGYISTSSYYETSRQSICVH
jgi:hypothetical protein